MEDDHSDSCDGASYSVLFASITVDRHVMGVAMLKSDSKLEIGEVSFSATALRSIMDSLVMFSQAHDVVIHLMYPITGLSSEFHKILAQYSRDSRLSFDPRPLADFSFDSGARLLSDHRSRHCKGSTDKLTCGVRACCALIRMCRKQGRLNEGITDIAPLCCSNLLRVDPQLLTSLRVLPESVRQPQKGQETTISCYRNESLLGLLETFMSTKLGAAQLKQRLVSPTRDNEILTSRLDFIEKLKDPKLESFRTEFSTAARGLKDVSFVLDRMSNSECHVPRMWKNLVRQLLVIFRVINVLESNKSMLALPSELQMSLFKPIVVHLLDRLSTVDFQTSKTFSRIRFLHSSDPQLNDLYLQWQAMDEELELLVSDIWSHHLDPSSRSSDPDFNFVPSSDPCCIYVPNLGSFMMFEATEDMLTPDGSHPQLPNNSWTFEFERDGMIYLKTSELVELDNRVNLVVRLIFECEARLLNKLQDEVKNKRDAIKQLCHTIGLIDLNVGLASAAIELDWCRPTMVEEPILKIERGRHPVLENILANGGSSFVPNDISMLDNRSDPEMGSNVIFLSGPNQSGKSLLMKQLAIITYMAHVGIYVPADRAEVGITDQIIAHMDLAESVHSKLSKFQSSCSDMFEIIRSCTKHSFIIVDEFGTGTDPTSGVALLGSLIHHFSTRERGSPRIIFASHFQELVGMALLDKCPIQKLSMSVECASGPNSPEVTYLYRAVHGLCTSSLAIICAKSRGVNEATTDRALEVLVRLK
eukprot:GHVH01015935.1.p1 GENE.GHVH01015935.1~~GHVH01015935.1.p1  ORF type:complete len:782 (-),score=104.32 GHVH01015935.1:762-3035(-)